MENNSFKFTYSAKEQEEIKNIRKKYAPEEQTEDKMEKLRRLDKSVSDKASMASLVLGIISALILGIGMCFCLVWEMFFPGIIIGIIGIVGVSLAYPLYNKVINNQRQKIAPEILRLTEELMK